MHLSREMLHQIGESSMHLLFGNHVIIIQDQHKVFCAVQQEIAQCRQDVLERWCLMRLQILEERGKALWLLVTQRREDIVPEELGVIVLLIEGEPSHDRVTVW